MSSKIIEYQIYNLSVEMIRKDEPKCIDMLNELAKMEEFDVNKLYNLSGYKQSLLHRSCKYGLSKVSKHLIEVLKANVNTKDEIDDTALHIASSHGHIDIVRYLIDNNATNIDVNIRDNYGCTALHCASRRGHIDIVRYLINNTSIDVNIQNNYENTALHLACYSNRREVVLELLKCNQINVFIKNNRNETAEQVARRKSYHDIAELIANYEPDIDILNNK